MRDSIINSFDTWIAAQGLKSKLRIKNVDNISLEGIERLRELILELAVRGKLVEQDPLDEPAKVLVEKISVERDKLISEGKIKKQKEFPEIDNDEKHFKVPDGWHWVRIETVGHDWGQKEPTGEFNYIEVSGIDSDKGIINSTSLLTHTNAPSRARKIVKKGTVIYSTVRPYLKNICVVDKDYFPEPIASTAFAVLHPLQMMPGKFFAYYFRSPVFVRYVESIQIGIAYPAINDKQFFGAVVPLPPVAEQHRIVAKVNELMSLCDELEQQETNHLKSHQLLVETLLGTLTNAADAKEFQTAWSRLAQHFDDLFTTEDSIDQLKQTILQLAVMGKLVPQDPKDEPASVLLEKIAQEKEKLVEEGEIKRQKPLPEITEEERRFELPIGWKLVRLGNTGIGSTGKTPSTNVGEYFGGKIPFIGPGQITQAGAITESDKSLTEKGCLYSEVANAGDIFMVCIGGSIGKAAIVTSKVAFNQQLNCISPLLISTQYLLNAMNSKHFQLELIKKSTGSATPIINRGKWEELIVSLPPLNEQHRIVAKVDELFGFCDRLKEGIIESQKVVNLMANSIVEQVV